MTTETADQVVAEIREACGTHNANVAHAIDAGLWGQRYKRPLFTNNASAAAVEWDRAYSEANGRAARWHDATYRAMDARG